MNPPDDPLRRKVMATLAALPLLGMSSPSVGDSTKSKSGSRTLVAYFSRSGNTRVVAGLIQRATHADVFEIRSAKPYPEEYLATVAQAQQERDSGFEPPLDSNVANVADYDSIFLGFPIWGTTTPPAIRTFLSNHDLSGKMVVPFITHGGYGLGDSYSVLASHAPKAHLIDGFSMEADQERKTMEQVERWLSSANVHG
ncbi:flavodoxin [Pseudomonas savastanoi pv. retacarpa]|uniref:Flavodoxin protein n=2 Tax=Pseudomonas savastanoi TaxID=29438 RepID=A0AB74BI75_PSESS|nr:MULTISPECIES: flavodoxin [Pseudomonas]ARD13748.1 flavodoxin [Pseudomonas savastanoi pv. savastanoi NCPPB 3335]KAA3545345.1 flavodoxin [Pseudomonas savastanoi]KPB17154.1 Flavodoxin [Pseudomonas savastanoi]KPY42106.1 Flavodoxin protein [Pseudomonas savastanoi pv. retacarpa]KUG40650.1 Flavodoxin protein [Pseudomonas savastanoi pv. fraxini]